MTNTNADYGGLPKSMDDLMTEDERHALTEDLARIHKTMYPCWARQIDRSEES
jgi:hypothetical protein